MSRDTPPETPTEPIEPTETSPNDTPEPHKFDDEIVDKDTPTEAEVNDLLAALASDEEATRLTTLERLGSLDLEATADYEPVLQALEQTAVQDESQIVREAALKALAAPLYRHLQRRRSRLPQGVRQAILIEISRWQADGLISAHVAGLLGQRYDFRLPTPQATAEPSAPTADQPRPSLSEILLSESTIKVALYLGAFFVISAACILASAIEVLHLPLLGITVTFSVLSGIPTLILIDCTGLVLLILGVIALLQRERLLTMTNRLGDQMSGWRA